MIACPAEKDVKHGGGVVRVLGQRAPPAALRGRESASISTAKRKASLLRADTERTIDEIKQALSLLRRHL